MRIEHIECIIYNFDELKENVKQQVLSSFRESIQNLNFELLKENLFPNLFRRSICLRLQVKREKPY